MSNRFLGIIILVLICVTIIIVSFLKNDPCMQRLSEYDLSVIQVVGGVIDYKYKIDTILVKDIDGNVLYAEDGADSTEIKGYHLWGWKQTSNILWSSLDSIRILYKLKE